MPTALVDVVCAPPAGGSEEFFASPGLLRLGRQLARGGEELLYYRHRHQSGGRAPANDAATAQLESSVPLPLVQAERVMIAASGPAWEGGETLRRVLKEHYGRAGRSSVEVTLVEPAELAPAERPDYRLARGHVRRQAELDAVPWWAPPHPWAWAQLEPPQESSLEPGPAALAEALERRRAAAAGLAGEMGASLLLNDSSVPLTMERLRELAQLVQQCLDEHKTLIQFDLHVWPYELVRDPRLVEHLSLLPLQSINLLAGSFNPLMAARDPRTRSLDVLRTALGLLGSAGLSHLASVSLVVGLPGERAEDCIDGMNHAVETMTSAQVPRLRIALCLGAGPAPRSAAEQHQRFLSRHPDWHALEYCGLFDMAVLLQGAVPGLVLSGPGLLPSWEPSPAGP